MNDWMHKVGRNWLSVSPGFNYPAEMYVKFQREMEVKGSKMRGQVARALNDLRKVKAEEMPNFNMGATHPCRTSKSVIQHQNRLRRGWQTYVHFCFRKGQLAKILG